MRKKTKFSLSEIKKFLKTKDFVILKKDSLKSTSGLYYTFLSGIIIILFSFSTPIIINYKNEIFYQSEEVKNSSKIKLEKVLKGEVLEEQVEILDNAEVFEDIFKYENIPTDTVRLSASTIEQLFKDTNYTLKDVRKSFLGG